MKLYLNNLIARYPNLLRISQNSFWLMADCIIRFGIGVFIAAWMARYLGPETFGAFNYAIAVSSFIAFFATLGLNEIVVKSLIEKPQQTGAILGTVLISRIVAVVLVLAGCLSFIVVQEKNPTVLYMTIILGVGTVFQVFDVIDVFFQSGLRSRFSVIAKNAAFLLISSLKILAIFLKQPVLIFAWLGAFEITLGAVNLVIAYGMTKGVNRLRFDRGVLQDLWRSGWPMGLASLAAIAYSRVDQILIRHFLGDSQLGVYSAATRITEMLAVVAPLLYLSAFPVIISLRNSGNDQVYRQNLRSLILMVFSFCSVVALATAIFASPLVGLFYGSSFMASADLLRVHVISLPFISLGGLTTYALVVEGKTLLHCGRVVAACIFNVISMVILIPVFGGKAAVWVALVTYALPTVILLFIKRFRDQWIFF